MLAAMKAKISPGRLLIDGQWVDGSKKFDTINPASGEVLTQIAEASPADVDRAVDAARRAFEDRSGAWRKLSASERGRLIWKLADLVEKNIDELAELETLDNGKPIFESRYVDMPMVSDVLRYYAGLATKIHGETVNTFETAFTYTLREPVGVVGLIVPWNFPLLLASWKLGPALACGNTIVWKPASLTSLTALRFGELSIEAGLPAGVLNIVTGRAEIGRAMVRHPGIDKIAFTGSTDVGKEILSSAANRPTSSLPIPTLITPSRARSPGSFTARVKSAMRAHGCSSRAKCKTNFSKSWWLVPRRCSLPILSIPKPAWVQSSARSRCEP